MWKSVLRRGGRDVLSLVITGVLAYYANNPWLIAAKPLLTAFGKWLRERGVQNVPF